MSLPAHVQREVDTPSQIQDARYTQSGRPRKPKPLTPRLITDYAEGAPPRVEAA